MRLSQATELRLREELRKLSEVELPKIREAVYEARTQGDSSQNPDYFTVAEEEGMVLARIEQIRHALAQHESSVDQDRSWDRAVPGCVIVLDFGDGREKMYFGSIEESGDLEVLTPGSPIGRAVDGRQVGDRIELPTGLSVTVVAVEAP
jgi:transcription elongation factor GreA